MFELVPSGFHLDIDPNGEVLGFESNNGSEYIPFSNRYFYEVNDILGGILKSHLNKITAQPKNIVQIADLAGGAKSRAAHFIAENWPNVWVYNIDPIVDTSVVASNFTPIRAYAEDLDDHFPDNSLDLIYSSYLFTNYDNPESLAKRAKVLEMVARKLSPSGLALINDLDYEIPAYLPDLRLLLQKLHEQQGVSKVKIFTPGYQDLLLMRKVSLPRQA